MKSLALRLSHQRQPPIWIIAFALLAVCFAAYGVLARQLGFYWDDWFISYYIRHFGSSIFWEAFAQDRPLLGSIYAPLTWLVGESPVAWQYTAFFTYWIACLACWKLLQLLWPCRTFQVTAIALLFAVYPGFRKHFVAITYSHLFVTLVLSLSTVGLMLWALRRPKNFWPIYLASILLGAYNLFLQEYFFGLELLRPLLIWIVLGESNPRPGPRLKRTTLLWLPYLLLIFLFMAWRTATPTPRGDLIIFGQLLTAPWSTIIDLAHRVAADLITVTVLGWGIAFDWTTIARFPPLVIAKYIIIVIATALVAMCSLYLMPKGQAANISSPGIATNQSTNSVQDRRRWALQAVGVGVFSLLVSGIPFWITGLQVMLKFPRDRFTLPYMLGIAILFVGLIELLRTARWQTILIVGIFVGLGAGAQYQSALTYLQDWLYQKDFFWQLAWRAPAIQPGTVLLTSDVPFTYNMDDSLAAPLNSLYAPENASQQVPYHYYNAEAHLTRGQPRLKANEPIGGISRLTTFNGSTSQAIVVYYVPPACLQVVDPSVDQSIPDKPRFYRELLPFAHPEYIDPDGQPPAQPANIFMGPEPEHGWCYYYQKAELARQAEDWQTAAAMGDLALQLKQPIYRKKVSELTPFIEGYARTGQWEKAISLTRQALQSWENMRLMLCDTWQPILQTPPADEQGRAALQEIQSLLDCRVP